MFISQFNWNIVKDKLSSSQIKAIQQTISAKSIRGFIIDEKRLNPELLGKLKNHLGMTPIEYTPRDPGDT